MQPASDTAGPGLDIATMILAGGLGTRLRPVFSSGPKAMAPVGGWPFLEYQLSFLRREGIAEVILCVGHQHEQISTRFGDGAKRGMRLRYSVETQPLGTAGAIRRALPLANADPVLVLNGDSFLEVSLRELVAFHRRRRALATIAAAHVRDAGRYGTLQVDRHQHVRRFEEKSSSAADSGERAINGGVYVLSAEVLALIPPAGRVSLEREVLPRLPVERTYAYEDTGYFIDIGIPSDFDRAQRELPQRILL